MHIKYCFISLFGLFYLTLNSQPQYRIWNNPDNNPNQTFHTYGNASDFQAIRVSEDFGPRQLGNDEYQWHGGIDYNSQAGNNDYGDLLLALEGGIISPFSHMLDNTKSIIVESNIVDGHHLRYVHVFTGGALADNPNGILTGGCLLKSMDAPNDNLLIDGNQKWAIIVQNNGTYTAYGPEPPMPPGYVTFTDENGMDTTILVNTQVNAGDGFVPLGNSQNYPAQLHLEILTQTNNNGQVIPAGDDRFAKDPLQLFNHEIPEYSIGFYHEDDTTPGIEVLYPGTEEGTIQTHITLNGQDGNNPPIDIMSS